MFTLTEWVYLNLVKVTTGQISTLSPLKHAPCYSKTIIPEPINRSREQNTKGKYIISSMTS